MISNSRMQTLCSLIQFDNSRSFVGCEGMQILALLIHFAIMVCSQMLVKC